MPKKVKGGTINPQLYNIQGLITPGGYTHTVASNTLQSPIFAGVKIGGAKKKTKPKPKK